MCTKSHSIVHNGAFAGRSRCGYEVSAYEVADGGLVKGVPLPAPATARAGLLTAEREHRTRTVFATPRRKKEQ